MKNSYRYKWPALAAVIAMAGVAYAATLETQITIDPEITLSEGDNGHKPKLMRAADGTLISAFGDSPAGADHYYDPKSNTDKAIARDIFVKYCKPDPDSKPEPRKTCNKPEEWQKAVTFAGTADQRTDGNVSNSALKSSVSTAWKGGDPVADRLPFPGNTDKPNIKQTGPVMVLTWVSHYCPDGDLRTAGVQPSAQRSIRYIERELRIVPFACAWTAWSYDNGKTWNEPRQLSNGERDAKQDSSGGSWDLASTNARIAISWQEDPEGLQLGEGDGPGEGASGAKSTGGTDVWYTWMDLNTATRTVTFAPPSPKLSATADPRDGDGTERALGYRITDNWELEKKYGLSGQITNVLVDGVEIDGQLVEKGNAGASRPNIAVLGSQTILAWEETKGASGMDEGKFIRYLTFPYTQPPVIGSPATSTNPIAALANEKSGCVISQPDRSAKRVRFQAQSAAEATGVTAPAVPGRSGINIAIFWREGKTDKGGPADIVARRGMVDPTKASNIQSGLATARMVPAVDAACATSDFDAVKTLSNAQGENISSRSSTVTAADDGLRDDTELNFVENALAHRALLRGDDLWIGYNWVGNLYELQALHDNYNFWIRKFSYDSAGGSWALPRNVTNVTDKRINVREPRLFGTPGSNTNAGFCDGTPTQDATFCQNRNVVYLMWGTQENVYPSDPDGGADLGVYGTVSLDGGETFATPVRVSEEKGNLFGDDDSAFETQPQARPDGTRFYVVFNTENATAGTSAARYVSGSVKQVATTAPDDGSTSSSGGGGGGCSMSAGKSPFDPSLLLLAALGLGGVAVRRIRRPD